jgi:hypothetical protein
MGAPVWELASEIRVETEEFAEIQASMVPIRESTPDPFCDRAGNWNKTCGYNWKPGKGDW